MHNSKRVIPTEMNILGVLFAFQQHTNVSYGSVCTHIVWDVVLFTCGHTMHVHPRTCWVKVLTSRMYRQRQKKKAWTWYNQ